MIVCFFRTENYEKSIKGKQQDWFVERGKARGRYKDGSGAGTKGVAVVYNVDRFRLHYINPSQEHIQLSRAVIPLFNNYYYYY